MPNRTIIAGFGEDQKVVMKTIEHRNVDALLSELLLAELDERVYSVLAQVQKLSCGSLLLRFFDANNKTLLTSEDIAFHLQEPQIAVQESLLALAELGLIRQTQAAGITFFGEIADAAKLKLVHDLLAWQERWRARLEQIASLVDGRRGHPSRAHRSFIYDNDADIHFNYSSPTTMNDD